MASPLARPENSPSEFELKLKELTRRRDELYAKQKKRRDERSKAGGSSGLTYCAIFEDGDENEDLETWKKLRKDIEEFWATKETMGNTLRLAAWKLLDSVN